MLFCSVHINYRYSSLIKSVVFPIRNLYTQPNAKTHSLLNINIRDKLLLCARFGFLSFLPTVHLHFELLLVRFSLLFLCCQRKPSLLLSRSLSLVLFLANGFLFSISIVAVRCFHVCVPQSLSPQTKANSARFSGLRCRCDKNRGLLSIYK